MAYEIGMSGSLTDLRDSLFLALSSHGWSVSGNIVSKGAVFVEILVSGSYLTIKGGTGASGGALTGTTSNLSRLGPLAGQVLAWPAQYRIFIHTAPDEVYLVLNWGIDFYEYIAFGQSSVAGLGGTGAWFSASLGETMTFINMSPVGGGAPGYNLHGGPALFWLTNSDSAGFMQNSWIHHGLDGGGWSGVSAGAGPIAVQAAMPHMSRQPNAWNSEAILLPIQPHVYRPSNKVSLVADLAHARYLRIDNLDPNQILELGPDRWQVFPWFRKNNDARDGGPSVAHSGSLGWAIRYDGP